MPDADAAADPSLKSQAGRWLFGQEANTVIAFALFGAACWYGWYQITVAEPRREATMKEISTTFSATMKAGIKHGEDAADKRVSELMQAMGKPATKTAKATEKDTDGSDDGGGQ